MADKSRRICVILNAAATGLLNRPVREISRQIISGFEARGIVADIQLGFGGALQKLAREAIAGGEISAVIAGGGDGTTGSIAAALVDTDVPLGVLPLGRFNHFARDAGIPNNLDQAIDVISRGHSEMVDAGDVNGRIFINNASLGAYPFLILDREKLVRHRLRRPLALLLAVLKLLRLFPKRRVSVRAGGRAEIWRTPCVFVGNNQYHLELFALGKRPRLNGGELWIYIARQQTRLALVWLTVKTLVGLTDPAKDLRVFHVTSAEIGSRSPQVTLATDGEVVQLYTPLRYRIRPASLRIYVPAPREGVNDARDRPYFRPSFRQP